MKRLIAVLACLVLTPPISSESARPMVAISPSTSTGRQPVPLPDSSNTLLPVLARRGRRSHPMATGRQEILPLILNGAGSALSHGRITGISTGRRSWCLWSRSRPPHISCQEDRRQRQPYLHNLG